MPSEAEAPCWGLRGLTPDLQGALLGPWASRGPPQPESGCHKAFIETGGTGTWGLSPGNHHLIEQPDRHTKYVSGNVGAWGRSPQKAVPTSKGCLEAHQGGTPKRHTKEAHHRRPPGR